MRERGCGSDRPGQGDRNAGRALGSVHIHDRGHASIAQYYGPAGLLLPRRRAEHHCAVFNVVVIVVRLDAIIDGMVQRADLLPY